MTSVLLKRGNLEMDTHTGRMPCEDEGRDGGDASGIQGKPKIISNPPEARREAWDRFFPQGPHKEPALPTCRF